MRILHVTEAPIGGIYRLLEEFTRRQLDAGHDVHLLATAQGGVLPGIRRRDWQLLRAKPQTYPRALAQLRRAVGEIQPDVIHLHSFFAGLLGRLPVLSGTGAVPLVYQPHAWAFDVVSNRRASALLRAWERLAARRTTVVVGNCTDEIDEGRSAGVRRPGFALGVALDTDHYAPADSEACRRHRADLGITAPRMLVCIGRYARQKGQDLLVAAWEAAPIPDTELVFVGFGDTPELRRLAPRQWGRTIKAAGIHPDVRPWIWASDLLVLPSRYETVSLAIAESMSCGRPVVSTDVNGARYAVLDGPHPPGGAIVPLGDMSELLAQAARRLADPELHAREARDARIRSVDLFEPAKVVKRLDEAYHHALSAAQR